MNYKEYLGTLVGKKGTLDSPIDGSLFTLRFNESHDKFRNAQVLEVYDDFVVIREDISGTLRIPFSALVVR